MSVRDTSGSAGYVLRLCGWEERFSICQGQLWLGDQGLGLQKSSSSGGEEKPNTGGSYRTIKYNLETIWAFGVEYRGRRQSGWGGVGPVLAGAQAGVI